MISIQSEKSCTECLNTLEQQAPIQNAERTQKEHRQNTANPRQIEHSLQLSSESFSNKFNTVTSAIKIVFIICNDTLVLYYYYYV